MPPRWFEAAAAVVGAVALGGCLGVEGRPPLGFDPAPPRALPAEAPAATGPATGAIYRAGRYAALAADDRARRVGDLVTIVLVERTDASKSASAKTGRSSDYNLRLPQAKPFSLLPAGLFSGGLTSSFDGSGTATQSNQLKGEITVTVAEVLDNGVLLVRGQKVVRLNRGDEFVNISGLVRPQDLGFDNRIASTRVADARISYSGSGEIASQSRQGWLTRLLNFFNPF